MKKLGFLLGAGALASSIAVVAMPFNKSWHEASWGVAGTNRAGAGGIYGTGGRQDKGIKCSHCHIKAAGATSQISMTVTASPAFVVSGNDTKYVPGTKYTITVALNGEALGGDTANDPSSTNNKNGMAATIENASGQRAGRFVADAGQDTNSCPAANPYPGGLGTGSGSPPTKTTFMYGDCHGVLPLDRKQLTSWTFDWYAPAAGAGDLTLYIGMVDGNTEGESSLDDDATERTFPLKEGP
jgi:hypothetical protein